MIRKFSEVLEPELEKDGDEQDFSDAETDKSANLSEYGWDVTSVYRQIGCRGAQLEPTWTRWSTRSERPKNINKERKKNEVKMEL